MSHLMMGDDLLAKLAEMMKDETFRKRVVDLVAQHAKPIRSPYKESATISANHTASEPQAEVVLRLTATKSMMTHKMFICETEPGAVVIHKIETDHGGKRKRVDGPERPMPAFSVLAYNGSSAPIHDGPYFGRLDPSESLYFTVEFVKPSKFTVGVMGPLCRT
jgi:hypothetical protein